MRDSILIVIAAVFVVVSVIAITQTYRFNCIDLGFFKSCGISTVK